MVELKKQVESCEPDSRPDSRPNVDGRMHPGDLTALWWPADPLYCVHALPVVQNRSSIAPTASPGACQTRSRFHSFSFNQRLIRLWMESLPACQPASLQAAPLHLRCTAQQNTAATVNYLYVAVVATLQELDLNCTTPPNPLLPPFPRSSAPPFFPRGWLAVCTPHPRAVEKENSRVERRNALKPRRCKEGRPGRQKQRTLHPVLALCKSQPSPLFGGVPG